MQKIVNRHLVAVHSGQATSDGDGVKLTRIIGNQYINMLDPFLLLDCFESDDAADYIGGFPTHPHRGFETVTYMLHGKMRHKDSAGHEGVVTPGGVQWMTAGKGVLHSEMPEQDFGRMQGFQLWVNLPKHAKMIAPDYQEFPPENTPVERHLNGSSIRVIAGTTAKGTVGPVTNRYTEPTYMDITLVANTSLQQPLSAEHNAFIYVVNGEIHVTDSENRQQTLAQQQIGILSKSSNFDSSQVEISTSDSARVLLIAGKPLNESVARGGPFVMNTQAEVLQAYRDYQNGLFA
ncbi:pirin family protein [Shewanella maritima]|uniref:pirin family protein n=1 Tax=Shewanella maritima TaxID=2520507 RepID=UPI003735F549